MSEYTCCFCFSSPCLCVRPSRNVDDMEMPPPRRADATSVDLVERLRDDTRSAAHCALSEEAADEIERLREENRKLREAIPGQILFYS